MVPLLVAVIGGYLLGSVPVAVLVARTHGVDPREVGDRNPGFWNVKERLGRRAAAPVFAGDTLKGTLAALLALVAGGHTVGFGGVSGAGAVPVYAATAAAMIGHAWPVFAGFRGGRSVLTFVGGFAVICPAAFLLGVVLLAVAGLVTRSFATGARAGVFALPVFQSIFAPVEYVAGTGLLMCLIGLRFGQAARSARSGRAASPGSPVSPESPAPPAPPGRTRPRS
ncbi:glycerol-3-phosphate acyltransferase PlsY [Streptosporangium becharense]|uniref:Glycerol-3-phosphate acyltransferase n=1 Tax=Streptosporangium becharense TaxID=1816182 RepID=A0A7W9IMR5_9ACTN|nr:glycerol-3-phosphate acyltransferase [Streptosporangium becharense]MBB2914596.1 glycerol-3-phosphate acyltransferase PlsY [Streptosporangium becharense]MBB5823441.1 glycerol-3-phosphate acyltransferase PlsY [Streptosporangium becharense]